MPGRHSGSLSFRLSGLARQSPFTGQSFVLLGVYFTLAGIASLSGVCEWSTSAGMLLTILINVLYPTHLLICNMVTWVLIPFGWFKKSHAGLRVFGIHTALMAHNANIAMVSLELALSRQFILPELAPFAILYGIYFVIWSWVWALRHRIFYYFFLDVTLPAAKSVGLHFLLAVMLYFGSRLGVAVSGLHSYGFGTEMAIAALVTFYSSRIRFPTSKWWPMSM